MNITAALNIYAGLRRMLADLRSRKALGAVAIDGIQNVIIPKIERMIASERNPQQQEKLQSLLDQYETFSDPHSDKAGIWANIAADAIEYHGPSWGSEPIELEDVASRLIEYFYSVSFRGFETFNPLLGVDNLKSFWKTIVGRRAVDYFRDMKHEQKEIQNPRQDDDGWADPMANVADPHAAPEVDMPTRLDQLSGLVAYIRQKTESMGKRGKIMLGIFEIWWEEIQSGNSSLDSVRAAFAKKYPTLEINRSSCGLYLDAVKKLVAQYFEKELGFRLPAGLRKQLHMASADVLAVEFVRQRMARWILGR